MDHECPPIESLIATIDADIKKYDLSLMFISEEEEDPCFTYSIGLYHSFKHPEVVVFGLDHELAGEIINDLARRIKAGERYEVGKEYAGLLEGYNCIFREAPKDCYHEYFGYATAFYKGVDFPVLQLIWPDKENKWPWEIDFNHRWIWSQPLLEHWPDEKTKSGWVFDEPRNLEVFTTTRVIDENHPILLVCHDDDGDWQFLCGTTDAPEDCKLICLKDLVEIDPSVNDIADLTPGWRAWRENAGSEWLREPKSSDEQL
jgi:hypothetical protein